ncbi:hypothetical protein AB0B45_25570 [Nonomuraea sp. NPDC049152]|uniref:hypothetical protein n=1 Tax=Nonomuraea sp. NPDC049152 TaxID=3154350 RepID=UPI00341117A0
MRDVIEAGTPRRRRWIGIVVLAAVLAVPAVSLLISRGPDDRPAAGPPPAAAPGSATDRQDRAPNILRAEARTVGDEESIDVVFPDGTKAGVRYPAVLRLAARGSRPYQGAWISGERAMFRKLYAPLDGLPEGGTRIRSMTGNVSLWTARDGQVLIFEFGRWRIALQDRRDGLTFEQRMEWAHALKGRVTREGYLVLSARDPVHLSKPGDRLGGEPAGPGLLFGGELLGGRDELVSLVLTPDCERNSGIPPELRRDATYADGVCRGDVFVSAAGQEAFVRAALRGIKVKLTE